RTGRRWDRTRSPTTRGALSSWRTRITRGDRRSVLSWSASSERRRCLLAGERRDAGREILGATGARDRLRLELHLRLEALPGGLVEQPLGAAERLRRPLRQLARERLDAALELRVGKYTRHQPPLLRLARRQHAIGEVEIH